MVLLLYLLLTMRVYSGRVYNTFQREIILRVLADVNSPGYWNVVTNPLSELVRCQISDENIKFHVKELHVLFGYDIYVSYT